MFNQLEIPHKFFQNWIVLRMLGIRDCVPLRVGVGVRVGVGTGFGVVVGVWCCVSVGVVNSRFTKRSCKVSDSNLYTYLKQYITQT